MAEKRHRIIENLEVDQYLEAQGYTECDTTTNMEIWCITSAGKLASVIWCWMHCFWESVCAGSPVATLLSRYVSTAVASNTCVQPCSHSCSDSGTWCRSQGLLYDTMCHEILKPRGVTDYLCPPNPSLAFTSGLLKMISAHGGQALAFAFYWKHRDLERRIYQLWADRIS